MCDYWRFSKFSVVVGRRHSPAYEKGAKSLVEKRSILSRLHKLNLRFACNEANTRPRFLHGNSSKNLPAHCKSATSIGELERKKGKP